MLKKMRKWFDDNTGVATAFVLLSLTHIDIMFVLCSGAFGGYKYFMMPISGVTRSSMHHYGMPQVLFLLCFF